jgi:hypothetical protein
MNFQRLAMILTIVNLGLLMYVLIVLAQIRPTVAQDAGPVLRGRALEIIDGQGRVRASIKIYPADPTVTLPSGKTFPESVWLKLSDQNGRPEVKLGASERGAGVGFVGDNDATQVLLEADGTVASLKLTNKDGRALLFKP